MLLLTFLMLLSFRSSGGGPRRDSRDVLMHNNALESSGEARPGWSVTIASCHIRGVRLKSDGPASFRAAVVPGGLVWSDADKLT